MNKYVRGVIGALIAFGLILAGNYLISIIKGQAFDPEWIYNIGLAILVGILRNCAKINLQKSSSQHHYF